jgi:hypothetical protein
VAGWILRVFGLIMVLAGGAYFVALLFAFWTMPRDVLGSSLKPLLLMLVGSSLVMVLGGAMRAMGSLMCGAVRFGERRVLLKWGLMACVRDSLFVVGGWLMVLPLLFGSMGGSFSGFFALVGGFLLVCGAGYLASLMKGMGGEAG